ncbi:hypothetical protein B0H17DRAFT_1149602 [Mycena rosella]|uniref:Uncharacterized protein n=1 Tax=Mycena rosella TaxID=1033263 RepID=A0AAD7C0Q0_MYCRO|nr:hypothetical protein B0H17DRAFT_1149602 [Mycena rosella]
MRMKGKEEDEEEMKRSATHHTQSPRQARDSLRRQHQAASLTSIEATPADGIEEREAEEDGVNAGGEYWGQTEEDGVEAEGRGVNEEEEKKGQFSFSTKVRIGQAEVPNLDTKAPKFDLLSRTAEDGCNIGIPTGSSHGAPRHHGKISEYRFLLGRSTLT